MGKLKKSTIAELKRLGLSTDWPDEHWAQIILNREYEKQKAARWKKEAEEAAKKAAAEWPKELAVGAEIVEVASDRHVIITNIDFEKAEVTFRLLPHSFEVEKGHKLEPQTWDMASELERYRDGKIALVKEGGES